MTDTTPADMPIGTRVRLVRIGGLRNKLLLNRHGHAGTVTTQPRYDGCVFVEFDHPHGHYPDDWQWWLQPHRLDPAE